MQLRGKHKSHQKLAGRRMRRLGWLVLVVALVSSVVQYRYAQADDQRYTFVHHAEKMQGGAVLKRDGSAYRTAVAGPNMIGTLVSGSSASPEAFTWWVCTYYVDSAPVFNPMRFVATDGKVYTTPADGVKQTPHTYCNMVPQALRGKYYGVQLSLKSGDIRVKTIYGLP